MFKSAYDQLKLFETNLSYKINTNSKDYSKIRMNVWIGEENGEISDKIYSLGTFFRSNDMADSES